MHNKSLFYFGRTPACIILAVVFNSLLAFKPASADIYRFVTIDGVETFTDAPLQKDATVVIKEQVSSTSKAKKTIKKQKQRDIPLEEVVSKVVQTFQANHFPGDAAATPQFEIKLPPVGGKITSPVGMRIDPIDGKWRMHNGIDIAIPTGTPVSPAAAGSVLYSGMRAGYGNTIVLQHENGVITLYGHNSSLLVSAGQRVEPDTIIALSGNTGRSTGPHLHFEAWQAGTNITNAFMPDAEGFFPVKLATAPVKSAFRKQLLQDGTILFTNLP